MAERATTLSSEQFYKQYIHPPILKDKKWIYSNSTLKLWKERKHTIELIPVKSYKKVIVYPVTKTVKYYKSLARASRGLFRTANAWIYSNVS